MPAIVHDEKFGRPGIGVGPVGTLDDGVLLLPFISCAEAEVEVFDVVREGKARYYSRCRIVGGCMIKSKYTTTN